MSTYNPNDETTFEEYKTGHGHKPSELEMKNAATAFKKYLQRILSIMDGSHSKFPNS